MHVVPSSGAAYSAMGEVSTNPVYVPPPPPTQETATDPTMTEETTAVDFPIQETSSDVPTRGPGQAEQVVLSPAISKEGEIHELD